MRQISLRQSFSLIKHPSKCEKKYRNHIFSRIIERPHWRFVLAPFNANEFMKIILSNVISKSIFPLVCSYHKSSFSININVHSINTDVNFWNCKFRELRLNPSTWPPRSTCFRRLRNFVVSARLLACEGRRKSLLRNNNLCYWKLALRRSWPFPQAQVVRNSQKRWRVPNTLRNESPPYNHQSPSWHKSLQHPIER